MKIFQVGVCRLDINLFQETNRFDLDIISLFRILVSNVFKRFLCRFTILYRADLLAIHVNPYCLYLQIAHVGQSFQHLLGIIDL